MAMAQVRAQPWAVTRFDWLLRAANSCRSLIHATMDGGLGGALRERVLADADPV
jgi:hypothetical protein